MIYKCLGFLVSPSSGIVRFGLTIVCVYILMIYKLLKFTLHHLVYMKERWFFPEWYMN